MKEECLICKAPLEYLKEDMEMECELCHKKEKSKTRCVNGHYVCNECHMQGIDSLVGICMEEKLRKPGYHSQSDDVPTLLPYAWPGASYHGGDGAADGLQKFRRRSLT